jgi:pimeloyl-ACP methyl ester carboxylesterase
MTSSRTTSAVRLPYAEHSDPDGTPVVMLHGLSDSLRSFEPVFPHLPASIHAYAVTLRGHGDAPRPTDGYDVEQLAGDVVDFMNDAGIERAIVVGHSMGTVVATRLAIDAPERVAGLVLAGGRATFRAPDLEPFFAEIETLGEAVDPEWARAFQQSTVGRPVSDAWLDAVTQESLKMPGRVWKALVEPTLRADHADVLGSISAPTLLVRGELDEIAPAEAQEDLLRRIPDARLVTYDGIGHALHWEDPARFAADLSAFVRAVSA